jgi:predicted enzyme related to lactoylglutathione lyase
MNFDGRVPAGRHGKRPCAAFIKSVVVWLGNVYSQDKYFSREAAMASITGFGGAFIRANDPKALYQWYEQHLGLTRVHGSFSFPAATQREQVVFAFFKQEDAYFPTAQKAMINLQVDDLDGVLDRLIAEGVTVDPKRESYDYGKFGWFTDPEGNRVELWQPAATD